VAKVPTSTKPVTKTVTKRAAPSVSAPAPLAVAAPAAAKPVAVAAKPAPVAAPKPAVATAAPAATVELPKADAATVAAARPETKIETPAAATPVAAPAPVKGNTMNETITNAQATIKTAAEDMQHRATEMFGDMNTRAKDAMSKGTKAIEELVEFSKGNVEAIVASGRVAAKGAEEIAKYSTEYGRTAVEKANATAKQFAAVKSPTEFFQLQGEVAKQTLDALVAEGSKFTENYLKLVGEIAQPISNRVAVAAEKVKSTVAS